MLLRLEWLDKFRQDSCMGMMAKIHELLVKIVWVLQSWSRIYKILGTMVNILTFNHDQDNWDLTKMAMV